MTTLTLKKPQQDIQAIALGETPSPVARLRMSYEAFLTWVDEDTRAEWVPIDNTDQGEVIIHMPPKKIHQTIVGFLYKLLGLFVDLFDLGEVHIAPFEVKLQPGGASREPDVLFIAQENLERLTAERMNGPPDLAIEVISQDSVKRDRDDKFKEYQAAGVQEYWVIDPRPEKQRADFYHLDEATGLYELYATEDDEQVISHVLPGFWLCPAWLWDPESHTPLACSLQIEGVADAISEQIKQVQS